MSKKAEDRIRLERAYEKDTGRTTSIISTSDLKDYISSALTIRDIIDMKMSPSQARIHIKHQYDTLKRHGLL